jgi:hypothetical protein
MADEIRKQLSRLEWYTAWCMISGSGETEEERKPKQYRIATYDLPKVKPGAPGRANEISRRSYQLGIPREQIEREIKARLWTGQVIKPDATMKADGKPPAHLPSDPPYSPGDWDEE